MTEKTEADVARWAATQRTANAAAAILQRRKQLASLEQEYERRLIDMELAGVPKTKICAELVTALREVHGVEVQPGDGFSSWSVRQVLDSGRHRAP